MTDAGKSRSQLIQELGVLRRKIQSLEQSVARDLSQPHHFSEADANGNGYNPGQLESCDDIAVALRQLEKQTHERRQVEAALRRSEEDYRSLIDNLNIGIYRSSNDPGGNFIKANPAIAQIFGFDSMDDVMRVCISDLYVNPEDRRAFVRELIENGTIRNKELLLRKKNGTPFWVSCTASAKYDPNGEILWIDGIIEDITSRRRAEEALRENEFKFRSLFDLSPQAITLTDFKTGRIMAVNAKFCELFQATQSDLTGHDPVELGFYSQSRWDRFLRKLDQSGEVRGLPMNFAPPHGETINSLIFARLIRIKREGFILSIFHDVTEQKRLEAQVHQVQRIEAIGTLAGGIAHDFNNLLMAIQGNISLLRLSFDSSDPVGRRLKTIEQFIQSGSDLTRQLLGFARGGKYEVKPVNLNDLVLASAKMFGRTKKEIKIDFTLQPDLWIVRVDKSQIEQVLLNLYLNAWQAMPEGGELCLHTQNVDLDATFIRPYRVKTGKYVKVAVKDSGVGMDPKTLRRIFDPFFTTKEMGRGTGLGLASAYGIIKNHDGIIEARSRKGKGTTFEFYLPASEQTNSKDKDALDRSHPEIVKGTETILFVDDEEMILQVAAEMLKDLGYRALLAAGGTEALRLYSRHAKAIDLVVLDLIMPDIGGQEVYRQLQRLNPDVRVLFSSGYSVSDKTAAVLEQGGCGFLQKPFDVHQLSLKLRELLGPAR